ncbi:diacylglycerol/lipid kinase family protein [Rhizohabitans arisaemae]|uniref:diacylglycerol/lipid kinase family protein n=1 Tax=Rhizohabitans arisaemae TaxID=2720610 RepID=UPI0024B21A79|nr:diacylglycerol kinase family protein [Rhizohabitans arisaemae]
MRALLLVNPKATATNPRTRDVLIRALGAAVDLTVEETHYRGHAAHLAMSAQAKGYDTVAVLGGDGTINETVNGLLAEGVSSDVPALAVIPGGSANVFVRALGLPGDPIEATGAILEAIRAGGRRTIGLGRARWGTGSESSERYFTFSAGMGYDAEVIRAVEGLRSAGYRATPTLYVSAALRHYFMTDRRNPGLTIGRPDKPPVEGVYLVIVSNTSPWTYLGSRPVYPTPWATFETGIDLLGLRKLRLATLLNLIRQILGERAALPAGRHIVQAHNQGEFTLRARRPMAFQLDGDYIGEQESVTFQAIPDAINVIV